MLKVISKAQRAVHRAGLGRVARRAWARWLGRPRGSSTHG
eukprot:SAG31_NODE_12513_length_936_cov_0.952210_1_plen_39_part_10